MITRIFFSLLLMIFARPGMAANDDYGRYRDWDYDQDGYLRQYEFSNHIYGLADGNQDGFLNDDEWSLYTGSWYDPYRAKYQEFSFYDSDSDGVLENGEFNSAFNDAGLFDKWDYDGNGYLDTNEWNDGIGIYQTYSAAPDPAAAIKSPSSLANK